MLGFHFEWKSNQEEADHHHKNHEEGPNFFSSTTLGCIFSTVRLFRTRHDVVVGSVEMQSSNVIPDWRLEMLSPLLSVLVPFKSKMHVNKASLASPWVRFSKAAMIAVPIGENWISTFVVIMKQKKQSRHTQTARFFCALSLFFVCKITVRWARCYFPPTKKQSQRMFP